MTNFSILTCEQVQAWAKMSAAKSSCIVSSDPAVLLDMILNDQNTTDGLSSEEESDLDHQLESYDEDSR